MNVSRKSLWSPGARSPWLRLAVAMLAAPLIVAALLGALGFFLAGMTETSGAAVLQATVETAIWLTIALVVFTLTLGVAAVAVLWWLGRRSVGAWAVAGLAAGAAGGAVLGFFMPSGVTLVVSAAAGVVGAAEFVLIRSIAGVRSREAG